jgi:hypothetical protein
MNDDQQQIPKLLGTEEKDESIVSNTAYAKSTAL